MDLMEAMRARHSVRAYTDAPMEPAACEALEKEIAACNAQGGLHIQLVANEPDAFGGLMAHYGHFSGVRNYIALIGPKGPLLEETLGYYGERLALLAQQLGLNTCWVALTFSKRKTRCEIRKNEKLVCVLALGYGQTQGVAHKNRPLSEVCSPADGAPDWFASGMEAVMLAPTATNQQRFFFSLEGEGAVYAKSTGGFYSKVDLGIVKYHFEAGAGEGRFHWA